MQSISESNDRVKKATPSTINAKIEAEMLNRVSRFTQADKAEISLRIEELDKEWDIERYLAINMSTLALAGLAASVRNKNWLILPAVVLGFFVQHAIQGWCPPLPILRSLGIRTCKEIEQERYLLKSVRGDFNVKSSYGKSISAMQNVVSKSDREG